MIVLGGGGKCQAWSSPCGARFLRAGRCCFERWIIQKMIQICGKTAGEAVRRVLQWLRHVLQVASPTCRWSHPGRRARGAAYAVCCGISHRYFLQHHHHPCRCATVGAIQGRAGVGLTRAASVGSVAAGLAGQPTSTLLGVRPTLAVALAEQCQPKPVMRLSCASRLQQARWHFWAGGRALPGGGSLGG